MADQRYSNSFTATGAGDAVALQGPFAISVSGTFVGTVKTERSFDGVSWREVDSFTAPTEKTGDEPVYGVKYRFNVTAYTSGTILCEFYK